jgi:hypothetical protein
MKALSAIFAVLLVLDPVRVCARDQERPRLLISPADVELIRSSESMPAMFRAALHEADSGVEPYLAKLPDIPVPADAGGGYTHEQHKRNSTVILNAGMLYRITGEQRFAQLAREMLLAYAELYPTLGEHPRKKEQTPGRLFWQSLNEAVWLVTAIQGYDAVYDSLTGEDRRVIEQGLLHPLARFLSEGQPQTFDRIHNHGTWAVAAVGMTGYVLDEPIYVERALSGLQGDGSAGFMRQLDELFSPDGYYSEGPYYQRYALMPFVLFAQAIERNEPQRKIFEYRDGILQKAIDTTIQLSYNGLFFPINDAIKDKGLDTKELIYAVAIAFGRTGDERLLSIAQAQGRTVLTGDGFRLSRALDEGRAKPYPFRSMQLADGPDGSWGALGILRSGGEPGHQAVVFKATAQGMGHGHFDRLSWLFYDNGHEIVADYGAARFLNVESKYGGHYLPENSSWAKQTVAHNTLVVDEESHFGGDWGLGQGNATVPLHFETGDRADVVAARIDTAYEGLRFTRALVLVKDSPLQLPMVLDVLRVEAEGEHQYDLPLHFRGQVTNVSHELNANTVALEPLGVRNGYQHLWKRASAAAEKGELFQLTFLNDNRFYTHSVLATAPAEFLFAETGASDPNFNLRHEQALIQRVEDAGAQVFVSVLEPHGEYNGSREFTTGSASGVAAIDRATDGRLEAIRITTTGGAFTTVLLSLDADPEASHRIELAGTTYEWTGFFRLADE